MFTERKAINYLVYSTKNTNCNKGYVVYITKNMKYRKYFTQKDIAKLFNLSYESFIHSSAKKRYINAINRVIETVEKQMIEEIKKP